MRTADRSRSMPAFAALIALTLLATACERSSEGPEPIAGDRTPIATPTATDSLVIGLVGTMSGSGSWRGEDAFEGADVGVSVLNRSLKRADRRFELVTLDDGGDPARGAELVRELVDSDRTVGVIYAGPPEGLPEAESALADAGVPAMLVLGDLYSARLLTPHVFQVSPPFAWQARRLADYLLKDRRYDTVGALIEGSLTGRTALTALQDALLDQGGRAVKAASYQDRTDDLRQQLEQLRTKKVEAIIVQGSPDALGRVVASLDELGATYEGTGAARIASASRAKRRKRDRPWRPQVLGFDAAVAARVEGSLPAGVGGTDIYARGAHYLPVPDFKEFRRAFSNWWGSLPLGRELRSYEAVGLIGWAAEKAGATEGATRSDIAGALEGLKGRRFGGLDITFGPDDHTSVDPTTIGIWVVPSGEAAVRERDRLPAGFPFVPLARTFSTDGARTDVQPRDWKYLFRSPPPQSAPAPRFKKMRFGVTSTKSDPVH